MAQFHCGVEPDILKITPDDSARTFALTVHSAHVVSTEAQPVFFTTTCKTVSQSALAAMVVFPATIIGSDPAISLQEWSVLGLPPVDRVTSCTVLRCLW